MTCDKREGSVLIIVLLVLAAAAYLILESGKLLRIDYEGAAYQRTVVSGGSLLRAGVVAASQILLDDRNDERQNVDDRFDVWANTDAFFSDISEHLKSGELRAQITSEDGKIPINSFLLKDGVGDANGVIFVNLLDRLLDAHGIKASAGSYLNSIKIWLGQKDLQNDKYWYAAQDPGYSPSGKFRVPAELELVRWKDVPHEELMKILHGADGIPGLLEFVTVWSEGRINVNTAPLEVVRAMCSDENLREDFAREMERYRSMGENEFSGSWYLRVARMVGLNMEKFPDKALTVKSDYFMVDLVAQVGAGVMRSSTVIRRDLKRCVVLFENIH